MVLKMAISLTSSDIEVKKTDFELGQRFHYQFHCKREQEEFLVDVLTWRPSSRESIPTGLYENRK